MKYEERKAIIQGLERDINQYKYQVSEFYKGNGEKYGIDWETVIYYEREYIPRLEAELEDILNCW